MHDMLRQGTLLILVLIVSGEYLCSQPLGPSGSTATAHSRWGLSAFAGISQPSTAWAGMPGGLIRGTTTWAYGGELMYVHELSARWALRGALTVERWRVRMYLSAPHEQGELTQLGLNPYPSDHWRDFTSFCLPIGLSRQQAGNRTHRWQVSAGLMYRYTAFPPPSDTLRHIGRFLLDNQSHISLYNGVHSIQRHHLSAWLEGGVDYQLPFSRYGDLISVALRIQASPFLLTEGTITYFPDQPYQSLSAFSFRGNSLSLRVGYWFQRQKAANR